MLICKGFLLPSQAAILQERTCRRGVLLRDPVGKQQTGEPWDSRARCDSLRCEMQLSVFY